uniref:UspA domain protein n=1 Tax=Sphingobacterium sp. (strain 21) TaxID=743722 RepID=F4C9R8_SPHS2
MGNILFNAEFNIGNRTLGGPITVADEQEYLFVNRNTGDDIYFKLKKSENGQWRQTAGATSFSIPQVIIDLVGQQIDDHLGK